MKKLILFVLTAFLFQIQNSYSQDPIPGFHQPLGNYQGLLWKISGNGLTKPSYVYGALESNQKLAYHLIDSFFVALNSTDRILLEVHPDTMTKAMRDPEILKRVYKDMFASGYYPAHNYYRLLQPRRFDSDIFPMVLSGINSNVMMMEMMSSEMEEEKSIIDFVFMAGLKLRKSVHGLVEISELLDLQEKAEKVMKEDMKKQRNIRSDDYMEMMMLYEKAFESYRKGDLGMLDSLYRRIVNSDALFSEVLYPSYKNISGRIAEQLKSASVFAVMDATAMAGPNGIIEGLRRLGYELTPVQHYILTRPNKQKEKLEKMTTRARLVTYKVPTGIWEVKIPDYSAGAADEQDGQTIFVDYLNNTTFSVSRYPTHAMLSLQAPDYLFSRMDSVIYEFVPGKILKREDITISGYPGVEIMNKTTRGKVEQFRLIITPLEIIIFKVSGPRNYVKRKGTGRRFMASAKLSLPSTLSWQPVTTGHGEFSLTLPSYYIIDTLKERIFTSPEFEYQAWDQSSSTFFLFKRNIHHDLNYIEEDTFDLNFMAEEIAKTMKMEIRTNTPSVFSGFPAQDFFLWSKTQPDTLTCRLILRGPSHYLLLTNAKDSLMAQRFFSGFCILPFEYTLRGDTITDTLLRYSVVSDIAKQEVDRSDDDEEMFYYWMDEEEDQKEDKSFKASMGNATYHFSMGAEFIRVEKNKEHDYKQYRHFNDLWTSLVSRATNDSDMTILSLISDSTALFPWLNIEVGDTNSIRIIRKRFIVNHGTIYTLSTMRNSIEPELPFTTNFFKSFTPLNDTVIGRSIFEDNGKLFISHYISDDTQKVRQAISSLNLVIFSAHHSDSLLYIISNPDLMKRNLEVATKLIAAYGRINKEKYSDELEKLYDIYQGSPAIQNAIFQAIASTGKPDAMKAMLKILATDIPLPSDNSLATLAGTLKKNPEQTALLFPELFRYERYPEYSSLVYVLLDDLVAKKKFRIDKHPDILKMLNNRVEETLDRRLEMDQRDKASKDKSDDLYIPWVNAGSPSIGWETAVESIEEGYALQEVMGIVSLIKADTLNSRPLSDLVYMLQILHHAGYQPKLMEKYYARVLNGRDKNDALALALFLDGKGVAVPDSVWKGFASNPQIRVDFYRQLGKSGKTNLFDTTWLNQQAFAESFLIVSEELNEKDSLTFLERRFISTSRKSGYVYFYKYKTGYGSDRDWVIGLVGIQPEDTMQVHPKPDVIKTDVEKIYVGDNISELIDKQMKDLRKLHRKRFQNMSDNFGYEDFMFYEEEYDWED